MDPDFFLDVCARMSVEEACDTFNINRSKLYRLRKRAAELARGQAVPQLSQSRGRPTDWIWKPPAPTPADVEDPIDAHARKVAESKRVVYSHPRRCFYVFEQGAHTFTRDPTGVLVKKLAKKLTSTASPAEVADAVKGLLSLDAGQEHAAQMDIDTSYIAFKNGVYSHSSREFVPGTPEMLQSKSAPIAYDPKADLAPVQSFLAHVFPDPCERKYVVNLHAQWLLGNNNKTFTVMYGPSNTMKSTLARLNKRAFGPLVTSLPEQALTRRQPLAANAAAPHLIPCMSSRVVYTI